MKIQIRRGVFETNSSSVHSMTICMEQEYEDWQKGLSYFNDKTEEFSEPIRMIANDCTVAKELYESNKQPFYKEWGALSAANQHVYVEQAMKLRNIRPEKSWDSYINPWLTYDEWVKRHVFDGSDMETYSQHFITPSGDKMVAFGYYGRD